MNEGEHDMSSTDHRLQSIADFAVASTAFRYGTNDFEVKKLVITGHAVFPFEQDVMGTDLLFSARIGHHDRREDMIVVDRPTRYTELRNALYRELIINTKSLIIPEMISLATTNGMSVTVI